MHCIYHNLNKFYFTISIISDFGEIYSKYRKNQRDIWRGQD